MSTADSTETNAILASGLAIVGLLGVAAALLPSDMLPGTAQNTSEAVGEVASPTPAAPAPHDISAEPTVAPETDRPAVFKPAELQSISDGDDDPAPAPVPGPSEGIEQDSLEPPVLMAVPAEQIKAVEEALATAPEPADLGQKETTEENGNKDQGSAAQVVKTQTPEEIASSVGKDSLTEKPTQVRVPPSVPRAPTPVWNTWQNPGYLPPQFQQPQFAPPQYAPQPYAYPNWGGYPQR